MIERPPGPARRWLGIPLLIRMRRDYLGFVQGLRRQHGDVTHMHIGAEHAYDVFSPDLIREVLVDNAHSFIRWERATEVFAQAHGQSVLVTEGEVWQRQRRMLQPGFGPRRIADYVPLVVQASDKALQTLATQGDREVEFEHAMTLLAMDVILRTLFSSEAAHDAVAAGEAVRILTHAAMR